MNTDGFWSSIYTVEAFGLKRDFAPTTFCGRNYPAALDELLSQALEIRPHDRILDLSADDRAFGPAEVKARLDEIYRPAPFAPKSFDWVVSRNLLQTVRDPAKACARLSKIAHRGFIEIPSPLQEALMGSASNPWICSVEEGVLVFRRRPWVRSPFLSVMRPFWHSDPEMRFACEFSHRNLFYTQFQWEGEIQYRVEENAEGFRPHESPVHAGLAHLDQALNALRFGAVPPARIIGSLKAALQYRPSDALAFNALGCVLAQVGGPAAGVPCFERATELAPENNDFAHNLETARRGETCLRLEHLPPPVPEAPRETEIAKAIEYRHGMRIVQYGGPRLSFAAEYLPLSAQGPIEPPFGPADAVVCLGEISGRADLPSLYDALRGLAPVIYTELPTELNLFARSAPAEGWCVTGADVHPIIQQRRFTDSPFHHLLLVGAVLEGAVAEACESTARNLLYRPVALDDYHGMTFEHAADAYLPADPAQRTHAEAAVRNSFARLKLELESGELTKMG